MLQDKLWEFSWNKNDSAESSFVVSKDDINDQNTQPEKCGNLNRHYHTSEKVDLRKAPRTWRTRKDPFENVWDEIRLRLELMPETTASEIIQWVMGKYPSQFSTGQTRTLQRRIAQWHQEQESHEKTLRALMTNQMTPPLTFSITDTGIQTNLDCGKKDVAKSLNY
ncbi:hypothetical protein [Nitrosomonas sp. Nm166]|uniref:hypothetical protein n=1 Tax=Nitrosomonas sp. Nm166 TaxID=1881054 RepID=UPI0008EBA5E5|nr:hypothetical protein [Nitrosomonas sp. Nm166]SFF19155.1 hypothetical protein SAMN05428977_10675 [Nitrosomonas sp. Nm166]